MLHNVKLHSTPQKDNSKGSLSK